MAESGSILHGNLESLFIKFSCNLNISFYYFRLLNCKDYL